MSRLKRDDLAKQFELIVSQEVINHNKSIEATNNAIQSINKRLESIVSLHAQTVASLSSKLSSLECKFLALSNSVERLCINSNSKVNSFEERMDLLRQRLERSIDTLDIGKVGVDELKEQMELISQEIQGIKNDLIAEKNKNHIAFGQVLKESKLIAENFRDEILSKPDELPRIKEELEKKIYERAKSVDSVLKEMRIHNKGVFVIEKKIENLYSKIERLSKGS